MSQDHPTIRYVGPTTHLNDHRVLHAAKGITHIWAASIVGGLAIVLTGAVAYGSIEAQTVTITARVVDPVKQETNKMNTRLDRLEMRLRALVSKLNDQKRSASLFLPQLIIPVEATSTPVKQTRGASPKTEVVY